MEDDKFNNWVPPPASTPPAQQNEEFPFMNMLDNENTGALGNARNIVGANPVFFPPNQSSATPLPWRQMRGQYQTNPPYAPFDNANNSLMVHHNQPPNPRYHLRDPIDMNIAGNVPNPFQQNYPLFQRDNIIGARDNSMNVHPRFSSFQNPGVYGNSAVNRGNAPEVIDLTLEDGGSNFGHTHRPQMNNLHGPGVGKNVFYQPQDTEATSSFNLNQTNAAQFGSLRRTDGSLLSLGNSRKLVNLDNPVVVNRLRDMCGRGSMNTAPNFGGFSGFRYRNNVFDLPSSQNNMGQNNMGTDGSLLSLGNSRKSVNLDNHVVVNRQMDMCARGSMNTAPNFGGFSGFRNNIFDLPSSQNNMGQNNMGGFSSVRNNVGPMSSAGYLPNTMPSYDVQRPQANKEYGFSRPSNSNVGFMPNADARYGNADPYDVLRDRLTVPSRPFSNSPAEISHPAQIGMSNVSPSSADILQTATQPSSDHLQKLYQESLRNNSSKHVSSDRCMGSSFSQGYPGHIANSGKSFTQARNESIQHFMRRRDQVAGRPIPSPENYGHVHGNSSLKRSTIHPNPSSPRVQRRRTMTQTPSGPIHVPARRGGSGVVLKPSGNKCMLCKRDLAFPPEGPIEQPSMLPAVAVLPCQHTFHDHCLKRITPEDQKTDPPCIPCAMGEK